MLRAEDAPTMPHMTSAFRRFRFLGRPLPARHRHLARRAPPSAYRPAPRAAIVLPPPIVAPRPTVIGATSTQFDPMLRVVADHRPVLVRAVVVGGDRAGAEVHAGAHRRVADVGEVVGLRRRGRCELALTSTKLPTWTSEARSAPGRSRAYGPIRAVGADRRALEVAERQDLRAGADGDVASARSTRRSPRHRPADRRLRTRSRRRCARRAPQVSVPRMSMRAGIGERHAGVEQRVGLRALIEALEVARARASC